MTGETVETGESGMDGVDGENGAWVNGTPLRALAVELAAEAVPPEQVSSGAPRTGWVELTTLGGCAVGVWEMSTGAMTDVEADEVFVVLAGAGVLEVEADGDRPALRSELAVGDVVRLSAGMRTTWTVTEPLRKVYLTPAES